MSDVENLHSREVTKSPVDGSKIGLPFDNLLVTRRRFFRVGGLLVAAILVSMEAATGSLRKASELILPRSVEAANEGSPPNPYEFVRFNGQQGKFFTRHLTNGVFANGRIGIIDTTEFYLDGSLKTKSQAPYRLYPEDTYQIATAGHQYHPADLAYFVDGYIRKSAHPDYIPLVIRVVPLDKIDDPNAHSLLNITLPAGIVTGDSVRIFQFASDFSYLDVVTKNYVDNTLNRNNRVYMNKDGTATGKVDVLQYPSSYKVYIPVTLDALTQPK